MVVRGDMAIEESVDVVNEYKMMVIKNSCCDAHRVVKAPFDLVIVNYQQKEIFFPLVLCKIVSTSQEEYFFSKQQAQISKILQIIKPLKDVHAILVVRFNSTAPKPVRWSIVWVDEIMPIKAEKHFGSIITYIN